MPPGTRGVVIDAQKFSRRVNLTDTERTKALTVIRDAEKEFLTRAARVHGSRCCDGVQEILGHSVVDELTGKPLPCWTTPSTYDELRRVKLLLPRHGGRARAISQARECPAS